MNIDRILEEMNRHGVEFILIGGVNFLLRHRPILTFDVDFWIRDAAENLDRCANALAALDAEWGPSENQWVPVRNLPQGWLSKQSVYCLTSPHGAIDVFRNVPGLESWPACRQRAIESATAAGTPYVGLCDADMLAAQEALPAQEQNHERVAYLRAILGKDAQRA